MAEKYNGFEKKLFSEVYLLLTDALTQRPVEGYYEAIVGRSRQLADKYRNCELATTMLAAVLDHILFATSDCFDSHGRTYRDYAEELRQNGIGS